MRNDDFDCSHALRLSGADWVIVAVVLLALIGFGPTVWERFEKENGGISSLADIGTYLYRNKEVEPAQWSLDEEERTALAPTGPINGPKQNAVCETKFTVQLP